MRGIIAEGKRSLQSELSPCYTPGLVLEPRVKIVRIESFPIRVPRAQRFQAAQGTLTHSDFAVVVVETDAGITGYGEISSALFYYRLGPAHARDVNDYLAPALVGEDPLRIPALVERMDRALRGARQAKSG